MKSGRVAHGEWGLKKRLFVSQKSDPAVFSEMISLTNLLKKGEAEDVQSAGLNGKMIRQIGDVSQFYGNSCSRD